MIWNHSTQCWLKILQFMGWDGWLDWIISIDSTAESGTIPARVECRHLWGGQRLVWWCSETLHISVYNRNLIHFIYITSYCIMHVKWYYVILDVSYQKNHITSNIMSQLRGCNPVLKQKLDTFEITQSGPRQMHNPYLRWIQGIFWKTNWGLDQCSFLHARNMYKQNPTKNIYIYIQYIKYHEL